MITQREFLDRLTGLLDRAGIPYMVAGSMSSSLRKWAGQLGIENMLIRLLKEAGEQAERID